MPRTVTLKESQAPYNLSLDEITLGEETVILEREGQPVAAVVPFIEYEAFAVWREREEWEQEWAKLSSWEQEGKWPDELTPEMIEARVQAVQKSYGMIKVDDPDEALYIATSPELALENIPLLLDDADNLNEQL